MNKGVRNGLLLASLGLALGGVAQAQDTTPTNGNLPPGALASSTTDTRSAPHSMPNSTISVTRKAIETATS